MKNYDELKFAWLFQGGPGTFLDAIMQAVEGKAAALSEYLQSHKLSDDDSAVLETYHQGLFVRPKGRPALCPVKRGREYVRAEKFEKAVQMVKWLKLQLKSKGHSVYGRHEYILEKVAEHFNIDLDALRSRVHEGDKPRRERKSRT